MSAERALRILIADDEVHARRSLRLLLDATGVSTSIAEAGSGVEVVEALDEGDIDLLFLDIELGDVDGFDVLAQIDRERMPAIVFVTAYDQFALKAFEVEAIDYLLKPFSDERFHQAFERVIKQLDAGQLDHARRRVGRLLDPGAGPRRALRRILVRKGGRVLFLPVSEITWFEAEDYYCRVHSAGASYLIRTSLTALEGDLDSGSFYRTHRSAIVNLEQVEEVEDTGRGDALVRLRTGAIVRLSRSRRQGFEEAMTRGSE